VDTRGAVLATAALAVFAAAVIEAGTYGFGSPWVLGGLGAALAAAGAFVLAEARAANPMLPMSLFRRRGFVSPVTVGFGVNVCFYGLIFLFSLLFQARQRMSALETGLAFLPMTAAILGANLVSGRASAVLGAGRTILAGLAAMLAGCAGLLWVGQATGYPALLVQQILLGGGLGLLVPPMTAQLMSSADSGRSGVTSGAFTALRQAGSLLGVALFGSLAATDFYGGFRAALWISIAILVVGAVGAWLPARAPFSMNATHRRKRPTSATGNDYSPASGQIHRRERHGFRICGFAEGHRRRRDDLRVPGRQCRARSSALRRPSARSESACQRGPVPAATCGQPLG
jgi:DHA2 family methylenomycin A resistance protein-like MFS transporter